MASRPALGDVETAPPANEDEGARRSVLMVLYFYPPVGGISMSRNVRNVQYLPAHGWRPVVLTPRNASYHLKDPSTLAMIPDDTRVIRTLSLEAGHIRPFVVDLLGTLGRTVARVRSGGRRATADPPGGLASGPTATPDPPSGRLERIRHRLFFPDDQVGWIPFALLAAIRAHRATPFDAIYSTSSPVSAHIVAGLLKRATGLPWIAEFRDPWLGNTLAPSLPWLHRRLQAKIERWIVGSADRVVGLSEGITDLYRTRYPGAPEMATITSGYDRSEAKPDRAPRAADGRFNIVYTGTLDRPEELEIFLQGVENLLLRRPELREQLQLSFFGFVSEPCQAIADRYVAGSLGGVMALRGFVPRREALAALDAADAALILLGAGPGMGLFIGGKLFDYIGQNVQILAMLPHGDSRRILEGLDWGVRCDPDPADVERAIERLLTLPPPDRRADPDGRYDRAVLAGRLADSLDAIAPVPTPTRRDDP
jgi:glycosyltransferase involved in cell wall biosynthesis